MARALNAHETTKVVGIVVLVITLMVFAGVAFSVWARYPDNHTDNPIALKVVSVVALAAGVGVVYWQRRFGVVLVLLAACGFAGDYALDRSNVLISYEEWISRGMPEWGERR